VLPSAARERNHIKPPAYHLESKILQLWKRANPLQKKRFQFLDQYKHRNVRTGTVVIRIIIRIERAVRTVKPAIPAVPCIMKDDEINAVVVEGICAVSRAYVFDILDISRAGEVVYWVEIRNTGWGRVGIC